LGQTQVGVVDGPVKLVTDADGDEKSASAVYIEEAPVDDLSTRSGLLFPVHSIAKRLRRHLRDQGMADVSISTESVLAMSASLEYITAEVMEIAGNHARDW
jgi:hypothetical protein